MSLQEKSQALKDLVATYDTQWFLGDLSGLMKSIADNTANDQLGKLSSPLRQLYYLAGLLISSDDADGDDVMYNKEKWDDIVVLLNEIEFEYEKIFFPKENEEVDDQWKRVRRVAMPSFLSYFNQGPLNYEEQSINWIEELYVPLDVIIEKAIGLTTKDFVHFYDNLDKLVQKNFQGVSSPKGASSLRENWSSYTKLSAGPDPSAPDFIKEMMKDKIPLFTFMSDHGIINRFYPKEIVSDLLPIEKVNNILALLTVRRAQTDFLYYTETKPGNPLYEKPIVDIGDGLYQVFEVKQVIHAIEMLLEKLCTADTKATTKYVKKKGELLEKRIIDLFASFFKSDFKIYHSYYVDGCEQDILILWKKYAFIIEAKGYSLKEPMRDPDKAFVRIDRDFQSSIGYGYTQTKRVEEKFAYGSMLSITDKHGKLIENIDTSKFDNDFSIIVNLESFGQVQVDLSSLLKIEDDDVFPWAVELDDLEVFILYLIANKKNPYYFVYFLLFREELHGRLISADELEICAEYIQGKLNEKNIRGKELIATSPDAPGLFDKQYRKGMGFRNERYLEEKRSGKYLFL